jgi:CheY-like chemotaxis protein
MDMRMPAMDGYETTREIRDLETRNLELNHPVSSFQFPVSTHIPIIALTAGVFEEQKSVILIAGCDDFVRKPFQDAEIFETMSKYLGVRYVYEEEKSSRGKGQRSKVKDVLTPEVLAALPENLVKDLQQATERSNMKEISTITQRMRVYNSDVADALGNLADNFEYDVILTLIHQAQNSG